MVVLAGPNGICVGGAVPAGSGPLAKITVTTSDCNTVASAEAGGIGVDGQDPTGGNAIAFGLVLYGHASISFVTAEGTQRVPIVDNVYHAPDLPGYRGKSTWNR